jgi:cytosine/adenosine deaminase-related metal-dependent hydrolase
MPFFKADYIYPVSQAPIKNGVVHTKADGEIIQVFTEEQSHTIDSSLIKHHKGIITPGFINAHCHLELSHLHKKITEKTGLIAFIKQLQKIRNQTLTEIEDEATLWQQSMYNAGIVAVGDICNSTASLKAKQKGLLHYHNFIELFSFNPARAQESLKHGLELLDQFNQIKVNHSMFNTNISPHAPYSTSLELIKLIANLSFNKNLPLSIHNQECKAEITMYNEAKGEFVEMLHSFGINTEHWKIHPKGSMITIAGLLFKNTKMLWVHNTFSSASEIKEVIDLVPNSYFCLCPNANLFIEGKLPNFNHFLNYKNQVCLGTDSLASNHQLNMLSEMQTIQQNSDLSFDTLLQWATLNGASALGFNETIGSIDKGKIPGLNLIDLMNPFLKLSNQTVVKKLI